MIKINIKWPTTADWVSWRKDCDQDTQIIVKAAKNGEEIKVKDTYKPKAIKQKYYFGTDGLFNGKCAYCETYLRDFQHGDIEHYRPKKGVTDEDDQAVQVDYGKGLEDHKGYYWLSYSEYNLLPSCTRCNQASVLKDEKIGKHNRFPVIGQYAIDEHGLSKEDPLIIHPMMEDPEDHLEVITESEDEDLIGTIISKNGSPKGTMTISIFGLNLRDQLLERRRGKVMEIKALLAKIINGNDQQRTSAKKKLVEMKKGKGEYALVVRATLNHLESFLRI